MRHWVKTRPELASAGAGAGGGGVVAAPPSWPSPAQPRHRPGLQWLPSLELKVHTKFCNITEKAPTMPSTVESTYKRFYI